jgi:hypothetical protein
MARRAAEIHAEIQAEIQASQQLTEVAKWLYSDEVRLGMQNFTINGPV